MSGYRAHRRRRRLVVRPRFHGPAWYRAMQGTSLGDDTISEPTLTDAQFTREFQQRMLVAQDRLVEIGARWVRREELQRWLQIAATLSIPLAAVVWRAIFRASRPRSKT